MKILSGSLDVYLYLYKFYKHIYNFTNINIYLINTNLHDLNIFNQYLFFTHLHVSILYLYTFVSIHTNMYLYT